MQQGSSGNSDNGKKETLKLLVGSPKFSPRLVCPGMEKAAVPCRVMNLCCCSLAALVRDEQSGQSSLFTLLYENSAVQKHFMVALVQVKHVALLCAATLIICN